MNRVETGRLSRLLATVLFVLNATFFLLNGAPVNAVPPISCPTTNCSLDNGSLVFSASGADFRLSNSLTTNGLLEQPHYFSTSVGNWNKLTYSSYPLDAAIGTGSSGGNWTGSTVQDLTNLTPISSTDSYDSFTVTATSGTTSRGTGTIISERSFLVNSDTLTITNAYTLDTATSFLKVETSIRNDSDRDVSNLYFWTGTRDDYVGGTDSPQKERGNIVEGVFDPIESVGARAKALRIKTAQEGVLFYSTNSTANTAINTSLGWSSAYNQDPATSSVGFTGDDSYALSFKMATTLLSGQTSEPVIWFYAAGTLAQLDEVTADVAEEAGDDPDSPPTSSDTSLPQLTCSIPIIENIVPKGGSSSGGTRVTIVGQNLTSAVYMNNSISNLRISSSTKVIILTPAGSKGSATIRIDGCNSSASTTYLYDPDPVISSLSSLSISTSGGSITIAGSFLAGASLSLDGARALLSTNTDEKVISVLPPSTPGEKTLTLSTSFGSASKKLNYISPPSLAQTLPSNYIAQGDLVSLSFATAGATTYSSSGTLPAGLSLNSATGLLTGTATKEGIYNFSITASNEVGFDTKSYIIDIDKPAPKAISSSIYFSTKVSVLSATNLSSLDRLINRIKAAAPRNLAATITISGGNDTSRRDLTTLRHDQVKKYLEASGIRIKSVTSIPGSPNKIGVTASWVR